MTDKQYMEAARREYQVDGEVEIDFGAIVSRGSDSGAYVAAWVWVDSDDGLPSEEDPDREEEVVGPHEDHKED